jgi:hypothetical protein
MFLKVGFLLPSNFLQGVHKQLIVGASDGTLIFGRRVSGL